MAVDTSSKKPAGLSDDQRAISAFAGSMLLYFIARRHKVQSALLLGGGYLIYRAVTGECPLTEAVRGLSRRRDKSNLNLRTTVIVNKPRSEVYAFWRHLENWPLFMRHLENVDEIGGNTSVWRLRLPGVDEVRWETQIVKDEKDSELSLHSVDGAPLESTAKINFSDTPGNATRIDVLLSYRAPADALGEKLSYLLTPAFCVKVEADIHNFKHYFENLGIEESRQAERMPGS